MTNKVYISQYNILSAYGLGIEPFYNGLLKKTPAFSKCTVVNTDAFITNTVAQIPDLKAGTSRLMQMAKVFQEELSQIDLHDTLLLFATTTSEVDLLEKHYSDHTNKEAHLTTSSKKVAKLFGCREGLVISAACASSTSAICHATRLIKTGQEKQVLIFAADCISEFVFSGFSSLNALSTTKVKPFDKDRDGLGLGEASTYLLLSNLPKKDCPDTVQVTVKGYGQSNDANHMTGPSRTGQGLSTAITKALKNLHDLPDFIAAHGTGTAYNDAMEIAALDKVFESAIPTYSVKGAIGHTMGSAGLAQVISALEGLKRGLIPATVGLETPDESASKWVSKDTVEKSSSTALIINSGFGGVNAAVVVGTTADE